MAYSTSPATGARGQIAIGEQTDFRTFVQPTHIIDFLSESLSASENVLQSEAIRSDRGRHKLIRGTLDIQGDINFEHSAEGYGMLLRHALGDYVKISNVDGGIHARCATAEGGEQILDAAEHANDGAEIIVLANETNILFPMEGSDLMTMVYRDDDDVLQSTTSIGYDGHDIYSVSYVSAAPTDPDNTYTGYSSESVVSIVVAPVVDGDGNETNLPFNPEGGVILYGQSRTSMRYFEPTDLGAGNGTRLYLDPSQATVGDSSTYPAEDDVIIGLPCFTSVAGFGSPTGLRKGAFFYHESTDYTSGGATAYVHHLERGRELPTSGLTVEVDRDAAIFLYGGCKVNTLTVNFETNSFVTGTFSLVGREELSIAELAYDVIPGATEIYVDDSQAPLFNTSGGEISIGERTGITYTTVEEDYSSTGKTRISGIPASGAAAIDRVAVAGTNVDVRTSTAVSSPYSSEASPLTSFETLVYIDGAYEEALSGSVTLNNNLNTDKFGLGSRYRLGLVEEQAEVEASLNLEFDDGKNYVKFINGTFFTLEFKSVSTASDSEIGTTGVLKQAYYFLPKCKYDGTTPNIEGVQYITHDNPITAIVDDELSTRDLIVILCNEETNDVEA
ncbi:MAG: hypothetical protein CL489_10950 [Acidobacteria bacterium]|nr:hypothetical protein [Acidobacteriota bacterium]